MKVLVEYFRPESRSYLAAALAGVLGSALLVAMAWRLLGHIPMYDELVHYLAARSVRDHGEPMIADGYYNRAELFTWIVAGAIMSLGDTLAAARIPSLVGSVGLVMLVTVWTARRAGLLAGAFAALVLCLLPATVDLAVFLRFYTLHALLIFAISIAFFEAVAPERSMRQRVVLAALGAAASPLAVHFQLTSLIALLAIAAGIGAVLLLEHWARVAAFVKRHPAWTAAGTLLAVVLLAVVILVFLQRLRKVPLWAAWAAHRPQYYLVEFAHDTPLLWPLLPAAAIVALAAHRRVTVFCVAALLAALTVHSLAAAKSGRYVYYALPWLCVVWGCALSGLYAFARRLETESAFLQSGTAPRGTASSPRGMAAWLGGKAPALVLLAAALVLMLSQEGQRAARLALGRNATELTLHYAGESGWDSAVPVLQPLVQSADRVVTTNSMKALYYFGRYDYELNASSVRETETGEEFGLDERTGRLAIGTAQSTAAVLDMAGKTLIILEEEKLGNPVGAPADAVEVIAARCAPIAVPAAAGVRAWSCPTGG